MPENQLTNKVVKNTRCKTCHTQLLGAYCSTCGQKIMPNRLTLSYLFKEGFSILTNLDKGFFYTILMLIKAPGKVIRDYLSGATKRYYNPLRMVFLLATLTAVLTVFSGVQSQMFQDEKAYEYGYELGSGGEKMSPEISESSRAFKQSYEQAFNKYLNLFMIFSIPFGAFFSWVFFRKMPYNFAEHLVAICFLQAINFVFSILSTPFYWMGTEAFMWATSMTLLIGYMYYAYAYKNWLDISWWTAIWKSTLINTLGFLFYMFVFLIFLLIAMISYFSLTGETAKIGMLIG